MFKRPAASSRLNPWLAAALVATLSGVTWAKGVPKKREADDVRGQRTWAQQCQHCHGAENDGLGPLASALPGGVPNLQGQISMDKRSEQRAVILDGSGDMPAFRESFQNPMRDANLVLAYLELLDSGERKPDKPLPSRSLTTDP